MIFFNRYLKNVGRCINATRLEDTIEDNGITTNVDVACS